MMDERMESLGAAIRKRREELRLSQKALAAKVPCDQGEVSKWERGERVINAFDLRAVADALETTVDKLFKAAEVIRATPPAREVDDDEPPPPKRR